MTRTRSTVVLSLLLVVPAVARAASLSLGVLPVADVSGEPGGPTVAKALPAILFEGLADPRLDPVLLNPGGGYSAFDEDWIGEYGRRAGVEAVLVTTLEGPLRKARRLQLRGRVLDLRNGARSPEFRVEVAVKGEDLDKAALRDGTAFLGRSKPFEKLPVGRATVALARAAAEQALAAALGFAPGAAVPPPLPSGSCQVLVRVAYAAKGASSKSYTLVVNAREESLGVSDGVARVSVPRGRILLHAQLNDAPYRLPVQPSYSANTWLACDRGEAELTLEVGALGEAVLVVR